MHSERRVAEPATGTVWGHPAVRAVGWTALLVVLMAQVWALYVAEGTGSPLFPQSDKVGHLGIFALPALLAGLLRARVVLVMLAGHALLAEPLQGWLTTTRVTDPWDAVANLAGLLAGVAVAVLLGRSR